MDARSIRRAAEHLALKANRTETNKQNAQHSTGPITAESIPQFSAPAGFVFSTAPMLQNHSLAAA